VHSRKDVSVGKTRKTRHVNLALQGGGAHGAFTWGVLDRLLDEDGVEFGCISGTSAGAVNAVALASGLSLPDHSIGRAIAREAARATLRAVWTAVEKARVPDLTSMLFSQMAGMAKLMSPYEFNPLGFDPLRSLLVDNVDFDRIRTTKGPELLIAATDVATGQARLFRRHEMRVEAVLASACLPAIHHAIEIDGRAYWDGGFSANPDLITPALESPVEDTLIIQLNHANKSGIPKTAADIGDQVSAITFNQPFLRDCAMIEEARAARLGWFASKSSRTARLQRHRYHVIDAGRFTAGLSAQSKGKPDPALLTYLFTAGRQEATKWLGRHGDAVGKRDTAELRARYLSPVGAPLQDAALPTTAEPAPA
jgi:NTE family protein